MTKSSKPVSGIVSVTPQQRFTRLASLSVRLAKQVAGQRLKNLFQDKAEKMEAEHELYARLGSEVAKTLGEMKGAVMKVGQLVSQMQDLLPAEIADALTHLQNYAKPLPFAIIRQQIVDQLPEAIATELLLHLDENPFAAASIGQVHRGRLANDQEVIVKVQYPGVKVSCESDLIHLKRLLQLGGFLKLDPNTLSALFDEVRVLLYQELDYDNERQNLHHFQRLYAHDPSLVVPQVFDRYCSEAILTLSYEPGIALKDMVNYSNEQRQWLAQRLVQLVGEQLFQWQVLHVDPHPGNFACRFPENSPPQLVLYDYGAVKSLNAETVEDIRQVIVAAQARDYERLEMLLCRRGIRRINTDALGEEFYRPWLDIILAPFASEQFDFAEAHLHEAFMARIKHKMMRGISLFQPSRESIHIDRVVSGHYWNLVCLATPVPMKALLEKFVNR
jgi:predicted unusual protein kinase regulating ubiquinone biosynthesis (AarF/ABC1/UbiB family)